MTRVALIFFAFVITGCVSHKDVTYFNDIAESKTGTLGLPEAPVIKFQANDIIEINISSISKDANAYFQKPGPDSDSYYGANTYQVSLDGNVDIPLIGELAVAGKTAREVSTALKALLENYLQKPSVNIRLASFSITVLGEVASPGVYPIADSKVTILEAIGYAGDLTLFGKRDNILLIRNNEGERAYTRIDLNSTDFMNSEQFYLRNNDVIYVEPSKGITSKDDNAYRIVPLVLSTLTFIVVILGITL